MSTKRLFLPITKVDAAKGIVYGVLAKQELDRSGEIFDYQGSKPYFEKWSESVHKATDGKSFGNLRSMHGQVAAGKLTQMAFNDDDQQIEVAAKVVDQNELTKVLEGVYTGFSIGGKYVTRKKVEGGTSYVADPYEASLVDLPCGPSATFEVIKAEGVQPEVRKFHQPEATEKKVPTNAEVAEEATRLAKVAGDESKWMDHCEIARKNLSAVHSDPAEGAEPKHVLEIAVTAVDDRLAKAAPGDTEELGAVQQWTHPRLPGQGFVKKADLRDALAALDADEKAATMAAPVTDALKAVTDALDAKDPAGVKKNSSDNPDFAKDETSGKDKKPASKAGTKSEKEKAKEESDKDKMPMKSAVDVIARAKAQQQAAVPSFVERRLILKAAADLNAVAALPAGFIDEPAEDIRKMAAGDLRKAASLYQVSSLISLVGSLESFHSSLTRGSGSGYYYESDSVTVVEASADLISTISRLCDELGSAAATLLDEILSAMKSEDAAKAYGRGTVLGDLQKVGARNSTADKNRLVKAHDLLAEIHPEMCGAADKGAGDGDLAKVVKAQEAAFTKTLGDIADVLKDVGERVKRIEAQPVPGRPSHVNVLDKGGDVTKIIDANASPRSELARANEEAFAMMAGETARFAVLPSR